MIESSMKHSIANALAGITFRLSC